MIDEINEWHRKFGATLYNRTWELIDKGDSRTSDENDEMLASAFASRWHWGRVGDASNFAIGDQHIARAASYVGEASIALHYAQKGLTITEKAGWRDYRLAAAYETMARAHACAGNRAERDRYFELATNALDLIEDEEDRQVIADQIASVP